MGYINKMNLGQCIIIRCFKLPNINIGIVPEKNPALIRLYLLSLKKMFTTLLQPSNGTNWLICYPDIFSFIQRLPTSDLSHEFQM